MNTQEWRILDAEGNNLGPYSLADLQGYFATGNINRETLVWTEGFAEWYPAGQVQGLLPEEAVAPPPMPAATPVAQTPAIAPAPAPPPRSGAPTWLSIATLAIAFAALVLFFFPWISVSLNPNPVSQQKMVKASSQSGFQTITTEVSIAEEFLSLTAKSVAAETGANEEEVKKELKKKKANRSDNKEWEKSLLVLIAMIAIGLAVITALIGLTNKLASLIIAAQAFLAVAAVLIGIQMALGFPMTRTFLEQQEEARKEWQSNMDKTAEANEEIAENLGEMPDNLKEEMETIKKVRKASLFGASFEPACFATVGLLSLSLFLVVITISSATSTPVIISPANYQSPQPGNEPPPSQPPGGGLRFH
jgi:hypothetical protein